MSTVLTIGSFAGPLHEDHDSLINWCADLAGDCGRLIVGINSDHIIHERKGFEPEPIAKRITDMNTRYYPLIDNFVEYDGTGIKDFIISTNADILAVGSDWGFPQDYMALMGLTFEDLWWLDCALVFIPTLNRIHSSEIRKGINDGE